MKLHNLTYFERTGPPCGSVALSVLNGKSPFQNVQDILSFRKTQKPYTDEYLYPNFYDDYTTIYYKEILHFFSPYFKKGAEIINVRKKYPILEFVELLNPRCCYLVATTIHLQVVRNKKVWDTCTSGTEISRNSFNKETVKWFVQLK